MNDVTNDFNSLQQSLSAKKYSELIMHFLAAFVPLIGPFSSTLAVFSDGQFFPQQRQQAQNNSKLEQNDGRFFSLIMTLITSYRLRYVVFYSAQSAVVSKMPYLAAI